MSKFTCINGHGFMSVMYDENGNRVMYFCKECMYHIHEVKK